MAANRAVATRSGQRVVGGHRIGAWPVDQRGPRLPLVEARGEVGAAVGVGLSELAGEG